MPSRRMSKETYAGGSGGGGGGGGRTARAVRNLWKKYKKESRKKKAAKGKSQNPVNWSDSVTGEARTSWGLKPKDYYRSSERKKSYKKHRDVMRKGRASKDRARRLPK